MAMIVEFKPASEVVKEEDAVREEREDALKDKKPVITGLASHIVSRWDLAKDSKRSTEQRFMNNLRARRREYSSQMLAALRQMFGADYEPVYAPVVETKCAAAEAWIRELYFQKGERPWDLRPTPIPELPASITAMVQKEVQDAMVKKHAGLVAGGAPLPSPEELDEESSKKIPMAKDEIAKVIEDMAKKSAERMVKRIDDKFTEGGWNDALDQCIYDVVTFGTMILKGPYVVNEVVRVRDYAPEKGKWTTKIESRLRECWGRVNPFDIYPLPGTTNPQNGDFFEVLHLKPKDISDMLNVEGWEQEAVKSVLKQYRTGGFRNDKGIDNERQMLEGKESTDISNSEDIECLKFHGSVPGQMLIDWGMDESDVPVPEKEHDVVCWSVGPHVLKAIINPDPIGTRPYFTAGFRKIPDSFWHVGVPDLAESAQKLANAVFRSIAINVSIASGPQIEVDVERLALGEEFRMWPFRVWKATNQQLREGRAVEFFQPQIVTSPLMEVFELCLRMADEDTGVPRYAHGDPKVGGAGETASGLSMLMSQSAKGIKMVIRNIDEGVIAKSVEHAYNYILQYEDDVEVVGDLKSVAMGSYALMAREQQAVRRTEFLVQTANQFDMEVLGVKGRAELLRQALKSLDIDPETVIKTDEELEKMAAAAGGAAQMGVPPMNDAGASAAPLPVPEGLTPGAPPPAAAGIDNAGNAMKGNDQQLFKSQPGVTP